MLVHLYGLYVLSHIFLQIQLIEDTISIIVATVTSSCGQEFPRFRWFPGGERGRKGAGVVRESDKTLQHDSHSNTHSLVFISARENILIKSIASLDSELHRQLVISATENYWLNWFLAWFSKGNYPCVMVGPCIGSCFPCETSYVILGKQTFHCFSDKVLDLYTVLCYHVFC